MLKRVEVDGIGPANGLVVEPGPGTTVVTGENGRGRTLLLDATWRAMTGAWPGETNPGLGTGQPPAPAGGRGRASVEATVIERRGRKETVRTSRRREEPRWTGPERRSARSLVYGHANGGVSAWIGEERRNRPRRAVSLTATEVKHGETTATDEREWRGISRTLADCGRSPGSTEAIEAAVRCCVPERARPDASGVETAQAVAAGRSGSAVERMSAIACIAARTWLYSTPRCRAQGLTLMIDDLELHLHPQWQREALDGLRRLEGTLLKGAPLQLIATTNAPLVLASCEPWFDPERDRLVTLKRGEKGSTRAVEQVFARQGPAGCWLTSDALGLESDRSMAAEQAMGDAKRVALEKAPDSETVRRIDRALRATLGDDDAFWPRWRYFAEQHIEAGRAGPTKPGGPA